MFIVLNSPMSEENIFLKNTLSKYTHSQDSFKLSKWYVHATCIFTSYTQNKGTDGKDSQVKVRRHCPRWVLDFLCPLYIEPVVSLNAGGFTLKPHCYSIYCCIKNP